MPDMTRLEHLPTTQNLSHAAYFRILLPDLLPHDMDRILYLDSDLVVESDLLELWQKGFDGHPLLAVQTFYQQRVCSPVSTLFHIYEELALDPSAPLLNSGVMLLDLAILRATRAFDRVLDYVDTFRGRVKYADNDGLNAVFAEEWGQLDVLWNVQTDVLCRAWLLPPTAFSEWLLAHRDEIRRQAKIIHYTHSPKPWQAMLPGRCHSRWFHYLRESGWFSAAQYQRFRAACLFSGLAYGVGVAKVRARGLGRQARRKLSRLWHSR